VHVVSLNLLLVYSNTCPPKCPGVTISVAADTIESCTLAITENGFGKRTELDEYRVQIRGGKGVITYKVTPKTGNIVGIRIVEEADDVMLITDTGTIIRLNVAGISVLGRSTQGVTLMRTNEGRVVSIEKITEKEEENG
jgi:DNA gyrase subunit A